MAKVIIIGASRGIGLATVKEALGAGHDVTAFSRSATEMKLKHPKLSKVDGDALNPEDVGAAILGHDVVVQTLGIPANADMVLGVVTLFSEATKVLLPAMTQAGIRRLITVTGFGAGDCAAHIHPLQRIPFRAVLGKAYDDKTIQEHLIKDSDLDWTIARPGVLTNGPKTEKYSVLTDKKDWKNGIISRADVADFIVKQIESDALVGQAPVLRGKLF